MHPWVNDHNIPIFTLMFGFSKSPFKYTHSMMGKNFDLHERLTPSIKDKFPIFTRLHFLYPAAFTLSLVLSITLFLFYLAEINEEITQKFIVEKNRDRRFCSLPFFLKNKVFDFFHFFPDFAFTYGDMAEQAGRVQK